MFSGSVSTCIPLTFVIDSEGEVGYQHGNYEPGDEKVLAEAIEGILHQEKGSQ